MDHIPKNHPRAESLRIRQRLVDGYDDGLVAREGLIAHGRGEAFDYILGERTTRLAQRSIKAAAAALLLARNPVISVNGNLAALCARQTVRLAAASHSSLEVNLFYDSPARRRKIASKLESAGAKRVLGHRRADQTELPGLGSQRRIVDKRGIAMADAVLVALEDGDRTQALAKDGRRVIAIDLNPLSRTARTADITIVDNAVRAMVRLAAQCIELAGKKESGLRRITDSYDNAATLGSHIEEIAKYLERAARNA